MFVSCGHHHGIIERPRCEVIVLSYSSTVSTDKLINSEKISWPPL